ncbi:MAG: SOS response-associated peptidase [Motilibacteraceae bacterium]
MCGRYAASRQPEDLVEEFEVDDVAEEPVPPSWNVAPTNRVHAVLERLDKEHPQEDPRRRLAVVTWGLVPSWAKDPSIGSRMINARLETAPEKPAFRRAFAARRCLVPADGYYEWYTPPEGAEPVPGAKGGKAKKPPKQPFFITRSDGRPLAMAGLYELWKDQAAPEDAPGGGWLWTCTLLTTSAVDGLGRIHDRMPLLVEPERYDQWLDPRTSDVDSLRGLLVPAMPGVLRAFPVSTAVNNVRNDGPQLVEPLPAEGEAAARADGEPAPGAAGADQPSLF